MIVVADVVVALVVAVVVVDIVVGRQHPGGGKVSFHRVPGSGTILSWKT